MFQFFKAISTAIFNFITSKGFQIALRVLTVAVGVKGYRQAQDMLAQSQAILANKTSAGGKLPVVYGTRRVGAHKLFIWMYLIMIQDIYL